MTTINQMEVRDVAERIIAIVKYGPAGYPTDGMRPGEYYQVTIDPEHISPSGEFIRLGDYPGDEIVGWQRAKALTIIEILGAWPANSDEKPVLRWGSAGKVAMSFRLITEK